MTCVYRNIFNQEKLGQQSDNDADSSANLPCGKFYYQPAIRRPEESERIPPFHA